MEVAKGTLVREIEIRRHACTKKGPARGHGSHLSQDGVDLAREVAIDMGSFDHVLASDVPRTTETAIAIGYAVDELIVPPIELVEAAFDVTGHHERWAWEQPWVRFTQLVEQEEAVARLGAWLREAWETRLERVPDDGRILVISHGRMIEIGMIACLPDLPRADFAGWGETLRQCEGVRMTWHDGRFGDPHLLRARRCRHA